MPFDPEKYRKYLAETGWSEKVQDEYLETLWNIMGTFVDLAWGTDSVQTVLETEKPSSPENLQPKAQRTSNPRNVRIAVGTLIAERPPHRSRRAQFAHRAPTWGV